MVEQRLPYGETLRYSLTSKRLPATTATERRAAHKGKRNSAKRHTHLPLTPVLLSLINRKALPIVSTFHVPTPYGDFKHGGEFLVSCVTMTHLFASRWWIKTVINKKRRAKGRTSERGPTSLDMYLHSAQFCIWTTRLKKYMAHRQSTWICRPTEQKTNSFRSRC